MMSGYVFEKKITLGNIIQIVMIIFTVIAGYATIKTRVDANTVAVKTNIESIAQMRHDTDGLDVLTYKVDNNAKTLARIEAKLDEQ
ncbi:MAG: hypothetical protein ACPGVT_11990 [Maricaulaceae bacterium]